MITGDHPDTARAIAQETGIAMPDDPILTGTMLSAMNQEDLDRQVRKVRV